LHRFHVIKCDAYAQFSLFMVAYVQLFWSALSSVL